MSYKRTLVTCALPYANGPVHIGHLAGAYIPGDIFVRYLRMRGEDVVFVCGSDEHGVPITIKAREKGVTPQDIVDQYHKVMKDAFTGLGINFDIYSRTSSQVHEKNASEFFRKLYDQDDFITKESEQLYDEQARMFLTDRLIEGICPKCGNPHAYGDQCEKCGSTLSPEELLEPKSRLSGSAPVKKKTKHWYLPLDKYEPWLRDWILEQHKEWKSNVYGQCKSWLDGGLQPRAVSRDLDWGVPVPVEGAEGKVLYVWFDAPIGYISNTKELLPESWEKWWKSEDTKLVHFIGKDNIVFHCIVFPSMMKAHGDYVLPDNVPSNEFLNLEGDKISTSRGWAVWVDEFEKDFPGARVIKLEENYRSTGNILDAAYSVISRNRGRKSKKLWTKAEAGEKIEYYRADDDREEARYVGAKIEELRRKDPSLKYSDFAVLYRTNVQSRRFEDAFSADRKSVV